MVETEQGRGEHIRQPTNAELRWMREAIKTAESVPVHRQSATLDALSTAITDFVAMHLEPMIDEILARREKGNVEVR